MKTRSSWALILLPQVIHALNEARSPIDMGRGSTAWCVGRRAALSSTFSFVLTQPSLAEEPKTIPTLRERVEGKVILPVTYGLDSPDIYYPSWFAGVWDTKSTTLSVDAPLGVALFGGNRSWEAAQADIGVSLEYDTRWRFEEGKVIADRPFNVASICRASMGPNAVVQDEWGGDPNHLTFVLAPSGAGDQQFLVDMTSVARHAEGYIPADRIQGRDAISSDSGSKSGVASFSAVEVVRQIVQPNAGGSGGAPRGGGGGSPTSVKTVDTTTIYTRVDDETIEALQRTATFAVASPSQDPYKAALLEKLGNRAVDVREYRVVYRLRRRLRNE